MAAKIAAVGGIETGFRHNTKSIWGREKCNTYFTQKDKHTSTTIIYNVTDFQKAFYYPP